MKVKTIVLGLALIALLTLAQPTITVTPTAVAPGGVVKIIVKGQAGEKCGIEIRDPLNFVSFVDGITLSPAGEGSTSWQIPITARLGTYTVYVSCEASGAAPLTTFRVTPLVGGEVKRDLLPLIITALAVLTLGLAAVGILKKFGE